MEIKTKIEITITMNESEAIWLKETMQNPFWGQTSDNETEIDRQNRKMFWHALNEEGIR